ncbi:hypothetical protein OD91_1368 [Lutibacter sp. Hel_I_33_5]|uniref:hypothetical protein n=1 Tax=Lutibacter sp. Hel_I_33_5 TaxID=1566289 RepID=UPI0011ABD8C5|nr:hypothetical protein [Lutibacter sp. Hel_I_33_5]TVZ56089.1 hypothetical protein OD91_1368 [Lutibacter sp. Hel_I_33_5]
MDPGGGNSCSNPSKQCKGCPDPPGIPIDDWIFYLMIIALFYGVWIITKNYKASKL